MSKPFLFLIVGLVLIQGVRVGLEGNVSYALDCIGMIALTYWVYLQGQTIEEKDEIIKDMRLMSIATKEQVVYYKSELKIQNNINNSLKDKLSYASDKLTQILDMAQITLKNI